VKRGEEEESRFSFFLSQTKPKKNKSPNSVYLWWQEEEEEKD
jgi:hypothetical protein